MHMSKSKNIFTGKVLTLNIDTVTLPNGVTIDLEIVRHPGAAAVVPLKDNGTVVLIKQFRHAAGDSSMRSRLENCTQVKIRCTARRGSSRRKSAGSPGGWSVSRAC
jgi:hypothetical protein